MSLKQKRILLTVFLSVVIILTVVKTHESISTQNSLINILKRGCAEIGGFAVKLYDPFEKNKKITNYEVGLDSAQENFAKSVYDLEHLIANNQELQDRLRIVTYNNRMVVESRFNFDYQKYDEPKLMILRERYNLDEIANPTDSEFHLMLKLKNWLKRQWKIGQTQKVSYNFNALDILDRAKKGEKFFCSEYATTYVQILSAFGITARYTGLFKGHVVVEVWSNEFDKWIIMDPHFNIHYELAGKPLNALELHEVWINDQWSDVEVVKGDYQEGLNDSIDNYEFGLVDYYENFYVRMRNDWFSNEYPHWYPRANAIMNGLEWSDAHTVNDIRIAREATRKQDLYWPLNHAQIEVKEIVSNDGLLIVELFLKTLTPNFDYFLVEFDKNAEKQVDDNHISWKLHKGTNIFKVYSVNKFGLRGPFSEICLEVDR